MEKTVSIFTSFAEAEQAEIKYWQNLSGNKKLMVLEALRNQYLALNYETIPGFQRIYRIIKQA